VIACASWVLPWAIVGWFVVALLVGLSVGAAAGLGKTPKDRP
jgi:hypothetical protein